jgi:hypothetical protein
MTDFLLMVGGAFFAMFVSGIVNYGKREWVGLTDDDIFEIHKQVDSMQYLTFGHAIQAKLKEKNT